MKPLRSIRLRLLSLLRGSFASSAASPSFDQQLHAALAELPSVPFRADELERSLRREGTEPTRLARRA